MVTRRQRRQARREARRKSKTPAPVSPTGGFTTRTGESVIVTPKGEVVGTTTPTIGTGGRAGGGRTFVPPKTTPSKIPAPSALVDVSRVDVQERLRREQQRRNLERTQRANRERVERLAQQEIARIESQRQNILNRGGFTNVKKSKNRAGDNIVTTTTFIDKIVDGKRIKERVFEVKNLTTGETRIKTFDRGKGSGGINIIEKEEEVEVSKVAEEPEKTKVSKFLEEFKAKFIDPSLVKTRAQRNKAFREFKDAPAIKKNFGKTAFFSVGVISQSLAGKVIEDVVATIETPKAIKQLRQAIKDDPSLLSKEKLKGVAREIFNESKLKFQTAPDEFIVKVGASLVLMSVTTGGIRVIGKVASKTTKVTLKAVKGVGKIERTIVSFNKVSSKITKFQNSLKKKVAVINKLERQARKGTGLPITKVQDALLAKALKGKADILRQARKLKKQRDLAIKNIKKLKGSKRVLFITGKQAKVGDKITFAKVGFVKGKVIGKAIGISKKKGKFIKTSVIGIGERVKGAKGASKLISKFKKDSDKLFKISNTITGDIGQLRLKLSRTTGKIRRSKIIKSINKKSKDLKSIQSKNLLLEKTFNKKLGKVDLRLKRISRKKFTIIGEAETLVKEPRKKISRIVSKGKTRTIKGRKLRERILELRTGKVILKELPKKKITNRDFVSFAKSLTKNDLSLIVGETFSKGKRLDKISKDKFIALIQDIKLKPGKKLIGARGRGIKSSKQFLDQLYNPKQVKNIQRVLTKPQINNLKKTIENIAGVVSRATSKQKKILPKIIPKLSQKALSKLKSIGVVGTVVGVKISQRERQRERLVQISRLQEITRLKVKLLQVQSPKSKQKLKSKLVQLQLLKQKSPPPKSPPTIRVSPKIPKGKFPKRIKGKVKAVAKKKKPQKGFNVFGRPLKKPGQKKIPKLIKINKVPLTKIRAENLRNFAIDTSLARTGRIIPTRGKPKKSKIKVSARFAKITQNKFRIFKIVKGKRVLLKKGTVIEKKGKFLLDTPQERQSIGLRRRVAQLRKPKRKISVAQRKALAAGRKKLNKIRKKRK